jgi:SAM-dependent methyltransferase
MSSTPGLGVQYVPGHVEPFVDLVVGEYLPPTGNLLDVGGGGLLFAIPCALRGRKVTVVDLDEAALDVGMVIDRVNRNDDSSIDVQATGHLIETCVSDVLEYLRGESREFALVSAFRVAHFLGPEGLSELFRLTSRVLVPGGLFVLSGMTPYDLVEGAVYNEVYLNTTAVSLEQPLYRVFACTDSARRIRQEQNLGGTVHLFDSALVAAHSREVGFEVIVDSYPATRIVAGYIMRRTPGAAR